jgi:pyrroloquinoline quinone biosynthesis protein D
MKTVYFLLTHYDADRSTRLSIRLLREYTPSFYQSLLEPHIVLLTTGSTLRPGMGEDIFVQMQNVGHHESDMEMLNAGVALALSRGADLIIKLSGNRLFLNGNRLIELIKKLSDSDKSALSDHWCNADQLATDVLMMKAAFAQEVFPLPIIHGAIFSEHLLAQQTRRRGLWDNVLVYHERQPIHVEGCRRTRFYESIELLTNSEDELDEFIGQHYPRYLPLLTTPDDNVPAARAPGSAFANLRPMAHGGLTLTPGEGSFELLTADGRREAALNETAAAIWLLCNGERTVAQIQADLAEVFQVPPATVIGDVRRTLESFLSRELVWVAGV